MTATFLRVVFACLALAVFASPAAAADPYKSPWHTPTGSGEAADFAKLVEDYKAWRNAWADLKGERFCPTGKGTTHFEFEHRAMQDAYEASLAEFIKGWSTTAAAGSGAERDAAWKRDRAAVEAELRRLAFEPPAPTCKPGEKVPPAPKPCFDDAAKAELRIKEEALPGTRDEVRRLETALAVDEKQMNEYPATDKRHAPRKKLYDATKRKLDEARERLKKLEDDVAELRALPPCAPPPPAAAQPPRDPDPLPPCDDADKIKADIERTKSALDRLDGDIAKAERALDTAKRALDLSGTMDGEGSDAYKQKSAARDNAQKEYDRLIGDEAKLEKRLTDDRALMEKCVPDKDKHSDSGGGLFDHVTIGVGVGTGEHDRKPGRGCGGGGGSGGGFSIGIGVGGSHREDDDDKDGDDDGKDRDERK